MFKSKGHRVALAVMLAFLVALTWAAMSLKTAVKVVYDQNQVPTIRAHGELEAIYVLGYIHAKDRFFQMDVQRRLFSGTLSELLGPAALAQDVQLRTLGLQRAAERSLAVQTPEVMAWLEAYSDGVNAFLGDNMHGNVQEECSSDQDAIVESSDDSEDGHSEGSSDDDFDSGDSKGSHKLVNQLPLEYSFLEIDRNGIPPWTPLDSLVVAKGLAFGLSFDLEDIDRTIALITIATVAPIIGINPLGLYNNDLYPATPFDPAISIPSAAVNSVGDAPGVDLVDEGGKINDPGGLSDLDAGAGASGGALLADYLMDPSLPGMAQEYRDTIAEFPVLLAKLEQEYTGQGSNWFIASGALTESGYPMIANDPHLGLTTPSTFYEAHIQVKNGINVTGVTFPGAPGVVQGCNDVICWGSTVNPLDVTDVYQEVLLDLDFTDGFVPNSPTHIFRADGPPEPIQFIPQTFLFNNIGDGFPNTIVDQATVPGGPLLPPEATVTLVVPRRNNGPIVQVSYDPNATPPTFGTAFSVQYVGWSPTRELEAFRRFTRAESPEDFEDALQFFDVGSQNWGYADINGNIAYYTSAEVPLREDLQNPPWFPIGASAPNPPSIVRDGTGTLPHDWLTLTTPQPQQALDFLLPTGEACCEILPFAEMPQIVNPAEGYILNANNDPIGTSLDGIPWDEWRFGIPGAGRLYLSPGYAAGFRMGRIQRLFDEALDGGGLLTLDQFKSFQANNQLLDAEVFTPFLLDAFANASVSGTPALADLAADPRIDEAVSRLAAWDFSTPTGIPQGFDPGDVLPLGAPPTQEEIDASVAATIYSVWRGQFVERVIDQTLASLPIPLDSIAPGSAQSMVAVRRMLESYPVNGGTGQSLINFFNEPGGGGGFFDRRDLSLLRALDSALDLLASAEFAPAFANSAVQDDYRWGKLHRIVFAHPMGAAFSIPPPGSSLNVAPDLPGIARAGGLGAVDASAHSARADTLNAFMFDSGPARRFVGTMTPDGPVALEVIPGGESGAPGSPFQTDQLNLWLVNDFHPLPLSKADASQVGQTCQTLVPPPKNKKGIVIPDPETVDIDHGGMIDLEPARSSERTPGRKRIPRSK